MRDDDGKGKRWEKCVLRRIFVCLDGGEPV